MEVPLYSIIMLPRRSVAVKSRTSNKSYFSFFSANNNNQRDAQRMNLTTHNAHHTHTPLLEERLHQIVVFELREDGGTEYSTMTLRALYNYVVALITESCRISNIERQSSSSIPQRDTTTTTKDDNRQLSYNESLPSKASLLHHDNLERSGHHKIFHKRHKEQIGRAHV